MEIDQIIENLNKKENISSITLNNLENTDLRELEKLKYKPEKALIIYGTLAPVDQSFSN
jgi:hypothetical protein